MSFPKVVALDTDWTIFWGWLRDWEWGKGPGAYNPVEDNVEQENYWEVRDRTNHNRKIGMYADVPDIVHDILSKGAQIAIVSRNTNKALCDRALWYFKVKDANGNLQSFIDQNSNITSYDEIYDQDKTVHFQKIKDWAGCNFSDMILFDDEAPNNDVEMMLGVTFQVSKDKKGLTWQNYKHGIDMWQRNQAIWTDFNIIKNDYNNPNNWYKFLGWSGIDEADIESLEQGGRRHNRVEAARWGFAVYVADDPKIAKYFSDWIRATTGVNSTTVCGIWARNSDIWDNMAKIWVPEWNNMMTNVNEKSQFKLAWSQEDRDRIIEEKWGVLKPYVLFSRHQNMAGNAGLRFPVSGRFNEMVVYPQIQDTQLIVRRLSAAELNKDISTGKHWHYENRMKEWNITVPPETLRDWS